ncbi:putative periplasmic serine endoprotease DegP-like precursor [Lignipirellula cremea]|uniref:Putative periplasmic serine endoprotease DegP-like n=2 Tax=Lignipirellula cremea TaxID=2528010 RepID=A0A518DMR9_9BACT|nr:putative periplasmic serine endoprotease DegP-like precursor [Lignipirellula cremea]
MRLLLLATLCLLVSPWTSAWAQDDIATIEERAILAAVDKASPAVVRIETYAGQERVGELIAGEGPTTGLIVSEDGYILSSEFNFVQNPNSIIVSLPEGGRAAAQIVARDESRKLVLLKVKTDKKLPTPEIAPRDEFVVGQWTIAIGRTYGPDAPNLSVGILSAADRVWGKVVQTDAKISPSNYGGPIVDIRGRVMGILAPFSPQGGDAVAGAEWYDSGIGFAVPLSDVMPHLEKLKAGENLKPGLLGVSLKASDLYETPPEVAACPATSPAAEAGIKVGDKIVEVSGQPVVRQAQLKHLLGRKYAGDVVQVVVLRGEEQLPFEVTLTDEIRPYVNPFIGLLPLRGPGKEKGVVVRYVYPGSPAAEAGIEPGDRLTLLDGDEIPDAGSLSDQLAAFTFDEEITLTLLRGEEKKEVKIKLASLPTEIPAELPSALPDGVTPAGEGERPPVGPVDLKLAEEKNECLAYVPTTYDPQFTYGVVIYLHAPGEFDREKLLARWQPVCDQQQLILLAPQAADPAKWTPGEVDFISKALDDILANYNVDRSRIVAHGYQAGGGIAYLAGFTHRDRVRGIAAVDAAMPGRAAPADNDPVLRVAVYTTRPDKSPLAPAIKAGVDKLEKLKYPVTTVEHEGPGRYLNDEEFAGFLRWIDSLDRF